MSSANQFTGDEQIFIEALFESLIRAGHLPGPEQSEPFRQTLRADTQRIFADNRDLAVDAGGEIALRLSSLVLAARNTIALLIADREEILRVLSETIVEPRRPAVRAWLGTRMGITREAADQAFQKAAENFRPVGAATFGRSFVYEQESQTPTHSVVAIRRCLFNDFFRRNEATELTPLFCALDNLWANELNTGPYNVSFERPTLLSAGDDSCRFQFTRVDKGSS